MDYEWFPRSIRGIVYCGLFGFGQNGPYGGRPAYDDLIQGASTISSLIQRSTGEIPRYVPAAIADRITGLIAVNAILAALIHRGTTGKGQHIDVPMFETMTKFFLNDHMSGLTYDPPLDKGGYIRQLSRDRRPYQTKDGYVCAMIYNDKHWTNFFQAIGRGDADHRSALRLGHHPHRQHRYDLCRGGGAVQNPHHGGVDRSCWTMPIFR